ncbi:DUF1501 domain-containing protein [Thalassotalea crassostreae]|uniref:DUF1501 domain-containing protein n=1 Tax=Thalassotalea crassostreae TaxID=1763536 RepID=UPI000837BF7E|nr:DUF1501 domain-containing protein [Thalassotalea crassostreae]
MQRRDFVKMMAASLVVMNTPAIAALNTKTGKRKKLIWVVLRGAMDSLHTIIPKTDSDYKTLRPKLSKNILTDALHLNDDFAFHPELKHFYQLYKSKQLSPIISVGTGYPKRSHFDGQDFLESGLTTMDHDTGWLGRALNNFKAQPDSNAIAIANSVPISLRETDKVSTWFPTKLKDADESIYDALLNLYQDDELLLSRLEEGISTQDMVGKKSSVKKGSFIELAQSCGRFLKGNTGTDCAMLEVGGWDTHNNQLYRLKRQLQQLDQGIQALQKELGDDWDNTAVVIASEFGRTAKENGTGGTDHGTGGAMFVLGGAVSGGEVLGEWPGLAEEQLFKGRDLQPTTSTFSWIGAVLQQHWQLSNQQVEAIFPGNAPYKHTMINS